MADGNKTPTDETNELEDPTRSTEESPNEEDSEESDKDSQVSEKEDSESDTEDPTTKQVLYIHQYDANASTTKQKRILQLSSKQSLKGKSLEDVRQLLNDSQVLSSNDFKSPFCEKDGSRVGDDMKVELYLKLVGISSIDAPKLDIYFKTKRVFGKVDPATKEFIKQKLDLTFKNPPDVIEKDPKLLTASFNPSEWKAVKGTLSHAADLNEKEWSVIIRGNCLLSGHFTINDKQGRAKKIVRSAYNAFKLLPREFDSYEISNADFVDHPTNAKKFKFRIPRFRVNDDSSVTVVEIRSALDKSAADSSFKEGAFQISGSASYAGISAGLSVGGGGGRSDNNANATKTSNDQIRVNYNYPRVTLYWDPASLEVTQECLEDIEKVRDRTSLMVFHAKYGHSFSRRVQLGGRLSTSEVIDKDTTDDIKDQATKLKVAAALSVSHAFAQVSIKGSHENQSREVNKKSQQNLKSNIAWEATGGDTLLCNNPAEWCATLGLYSNWRIVEQDHVVPIEEFLAECPNVDEGVITRFTLSAQNKLTPEAERQLHEDRQRRQDPNAPKPKPERHQVFELSHPDLEYYLGIQDTAEPVWNLAKEWVHWNMIPRDFQRGIERSIKEPQASICSSAKISSEKTRFLIDKPYTEGQGDALVYGEEYLIKAKAHAEEYFLSGVQWLHSPLELLHLSKHQGIPFRFEKADQPTEEGDIQDGDEVYLCVGKKRVYATEHDLISWGYYPHREGTGHLRLKYHAKGIDSRGTFDRPKGNPSFR